MFFEKIKLFLFYIIVFKSNSILLKDNLNNYIIKKLD